MSRFKIEEFVASPETPGSKNFSAFVADEELEQKAVKAIARFPEGKQRSAVLPLLNFIQKRHGFISAAAIEWVAQRLEIQPMRVLEVVTFYPGFLQSAPGRFHVRICRTLSCAMNGSYELMDRLCELTGIDRGAMEPHSHPVGVSADGKWSVEFSECLACCHSAPVCMVNDDLHEKVLPEEAEKLIEKY